VLVVQVLIILATTLNMGVLVVERVVMVRRWSGTREVVRCVGLEEEEVAVL
jgi:hypothetical protein